LDHPVKRTSYRFLQRRYARRSHRSSFPLFGSLCVAFLYLSEADKRSLPRGKRKAWGKQERAATTMIMNDDDNNNNKT